MVASAGHYSDPYISLTARRVAGADVVLGRKVKAPLAQQVSAVITVGIISCDMAGFLQGRTDATWTAQRQPHASELSVLADVASFTMHSLECRNTRIQKTISAVFWILVHPRRLVRHQASLLSVEDRTGSNLHRRICLEGSGRSRCT